MKISVIMPTYNRRVFMSMAIKSFLNQSYKNAELIILNNGSTDDTKEFLKKNYSTHDNIKIIHREKNEILGCLNVLWNLAEGELICQLHDDDQLTEDSLSTRAQRFKDDPFLEVCYGGWHNIAPGGRFLGSYPGQSSNPARILQNEYINFTTMMWKNSLKKKFMFDEELYFQVDAHFKIRCAMECTMTCVEGPVMFYMIHPDQETNRMRRENKLNDENLLMRKKINHIYGGLFHD